MKKRILCLAMCIIMVLSTAVLFGCSEKEATDEETAATTTATTTRKAMTFVLTGIKNQSTTDEAVAMVEAEINKITHAEFNTNIVLRLYNENEYDAKVEEMLTAIEEQKIKEAEEAAAKKAAEKAAREAAKAAAAAGETTTAATTTAAEESTEETDETIINDYGIEQVLYPEENGTQLDIVLIRNFEQFNDYQSRGLLTALDEQLSIGSKILRQYIHPTFLSAVQVSGRTFAIPNNHLIGEYEYLLVNKELFDKYYFDPDSINDINDINEFLLDVIANEPNYIPLLNEPTPRVEYFSSNPSIVGSILSKTSSLGVSSAPKNLLSVAQYLNHFKMMTNLKKENAIAYDGYIGDGKNYAAAVIKGDYTTPMLYEDDYYVAVYKYPTANNENVYSGMYAVTTTAADVARCMQVIQALSINEEFINLYTYGVEGVHYERDEITDVVTRLNNNYSMNMAYTGNQFLMWQNSDMDELTIKNSANKWELAKAQNLDMVYSGYLGYQMKYTTEEKDDDGKVSVVNIMSGEMSIKQIVDGVESVSQGYLDRIAAFEEYDYDEVNIKKVNVKYPDGTIVPEEREEIVTKTKKVDDFIADLMAEIAEDVYIAAAIDGASETSPTAAYSAWHAAKYPPAA
jgi:Ribosomal protein L12E/L44/L45/RPP1/RPP2